MTKTIRRFKLEQHKDEKGNPEEFTSDAFLIVERAKTAHLDENGLPLVGMRVYPGMCLIGKFGARMAFSKDRMPNDLEALTSDESTLILKCRDMFYDASLYVPSEIEGEVVHAEIVRNAAGEQVAIVDLLVDE